MKYFIRFIAFLVLMVSIYGVMPIFMLLYILVYFIWNLRWPSIITVKRVFRGCQEIPINNGLRFNSFYRNPFLFLINKKQNR